MKRVRLCLFAAAFAVLAGFFVPFSRADEDSARHRYVEALRKEGFPEMAVDYLRLELTRIKDPTERADVEFEIAFSLSSLAETLGDLSRRGTILDEAAKDIAELVKKYPDHPRRPEALTSLALIDLQQGRIKILMAQLPANAGQMDRLVKEARQSIERSIARYEAARDQLLIAHKKMPVYIPEDQQSERRRKTKLFEQYIEARFQAALARFHLADSYKTIELLDGDAKKQAAARKTYESLLKDAAKAFEDIYNEHRREVVGLYAHLWLARCWSSLGDQRRANGIFKQLMDHDNKSIEKFQRQVFHFRMIAYSEQKQYDQLIAESENWLKLHQKNSKETDYLGVLLEVGMARIRRGDAATDEKTKRAEFLEADKVFQRISSFSNPYTGLARRQQLRLADVLNKEVSGHGFQQMVSVAGAKLDKVTPSSTPEEKKQLLKDAKKLLEDAIDLGRNSEPQESVNEARLSLAFAHYADDELLESAILAESIARFFPKSSYAPQAALLATNVYAICYERALEAQKLNIHAYADVDADRIRAICKLVFERWPASKEAIEARLIVGRLEYQKLQYQKAAEIFLQADPSSAKFADAQSLAGRALWDYCKTNRQATGAALDAVKKSRDLAAEKLAASSKAILESHNGKVDRDVFLNDAYLAEVLFDQGKDGPAYDTAKPYIDAIEKNTLAAEIETKLRIEILITALQSLIRMDKLQDGDRLVELIGRQKGQSDSGSVTQVFMNLAARIKNQIEALKATGDEARRLQMVKAFERFLNRIAERESGQTLGSFVDLATNFLELENYQRAIELSRKALAMPQATEKDKSPLVYRAKLTLADALSRSNSFEEARSLIDSLYRENKNIKEVVMKRGEILESQGDIKAAVAHWKDIVKRMQKVQPRPREFYEAMKHLVDLADKFTGEEKLKRLKEAHYFAQFLVTTDTNLPEDLRPFFKDAIARIETQIGK